MNETNRNQNGEYPSKRYLLGIVTNNNKHLILRFKDNHIYCPGDWDFFTTSLEEENKSSELVTKIIKEKLGVNTQVIKEHPPFCWFDPEIKVFWDYRPFLLKADSQKIELRPEGKYSDFRWVKFSEIKRFSRLNYFEDIINKLRLIL